MSVEDTTFSPATRADQFTFADPPTITRISPPSGPEKGGTKVTISGNGFFGTVGVRFGDRAATDVHVVSPSEITLESPAGSGDAAVVVTTAAGSSPASPGTAYSFVVPPAVTKITPAIGPKAGGTRVTIWGRNFVAPVTVMFGTKRARAVHVISPSKIIASVPPGSGAAPVTVTALGGSSRIDLATRFTFLAPPSLAALSPSLGPTVGGTRVTIRGKNFVAPVSVRFGRKPATHVHVLSSSRIVVTAPAGSGTVYVLVSAVGGTSREEPVARYRY
jgi:hypothetical protein